ncbi:MAG: hypothetical protein HYT80_04045 [Euryarchaeota archaeon]|nr:hypothetical protein [Euryarchaeota archaeon]
MAGISPRLQSGLGLAAVLASMVLGAALRLEDPTASPVLPAEDSFSNTALVREHLRDGAIEPLNAGGTVYPPGMHAYVAAFWVYTGADLYELVRFLPTVFGVVGIAGLALVAWRWDARIAAAGAALALAVQPEVIFRSTMFAPTAFDLALVPFLLFGLIEVLHGRLAWAGLAAPIALVLTFAHPWFLTLLAPAGFLYAVFTALLPFRDRTVPALTAKGLAVTVAIVGVGSGLALNGCWGACGPGFRDVYPGGDRLAVFAPLAILVAILPAALLFGLRRGRPEPAPEPPRRPLPLAVRTLLSCALAALLAVITVPAVQQGMPPFVDLPRMIGWPVLVLAAFAFVALPFIASPAANAGAALALLCVPLVVYNPFDSAFWPHRTVAFLAIGLALLAGVGVAALWRGASAAFDSAGLRKTDTVKVGGRPVFAVLPVLLVLLSMGSIYAATPPVYEEGWYRLYEPCQFEGLQEVSRRAGPDPTAVIIAGDWRPKLVLAAITPNADRVWYDRTFFMTQKTQDDIVGGLLGEGRAVYVVVEENVRNVTGAQAMDFDREPWQPVGTWCPEPRHKSVRAFVAGGDDA